MNEMRHDGRRYSGHWYTSLHPRSSVFPSLFLKCTLLSFFFSLLPFCCSFLLLHLDEDHQCLTVISMKYRIQSTSSLYNIIIKERNVDCWILILIGTVYTATLFELDFDLLTSQSFWKIAISWAYKLCSWIFHSSYSVLLLLMLLCSFSVMRSV